MVGRSSTPRTEGGKGGGWVRERGEGVGR